MNPSEIPRDLETATDQIEQAAEKVLVRNLDIAAAKVDHMGSRENCEAAGAYLVGVIENAIPSSSEEALATLSSKARKLPVDDLAETFVEEAFPQLAERLSFSAEQPAVVAHLETTLDERGADLERAVDQTAAEALTELEQQVDDSPEADQPEKPGRLLRDIDPSASVSSAGVRGSISTGIVGDREVGAGLELGVASQTASLEYEGSRLGTEVVVERSSSSGDLSSGNLSIGGEVRLGETAPSRVGVEFTPETNAFSARTYLLDNHFSLFASQDPDSNAVGTQFRIDETSIGDMSFSISCDVTRFDQNEPLALNSLSVAATIVSPSQNGRLSITSNGEIVAVGFVYLPTGRGKVSFVGQADLTGDTGLMVGQANYEFSF